LWPGGGGLMFGQVRKDGGIKNTGVSSAYLITDDPDAVFDKAVAAGATVDRPMVDQDYGGRGGTVIDPEGNSWSFGSYQPS
ncbi:VOC family protein, partial [Nocardioides sp. NPDC057772]|uniref:VOC family protein n=1 Tax=Nocardioides sp. NPDC057772 TaxID=3346245 RepID=UPI0036731876